MCCWILEVQRSHARTRSTHRTRVRSVAGPTRRGASGAATSKRCTRWAPNCRASGARPCCCHATNGRATSSVTTSWAKRTLNRASWSSRRRTWSCRRNPTPTPPPTSTWYASANWPQPFSFPSWTKRRWERPTLMSLRWYILESRLSNDLAGIIVKDDRMGCF